MNHAAQIKVARLQLQANHRFVLLPGHLVIPQQIVKSWQVLATTDMQAVFTHYTFIPGRLREAVLPPSTGKDWPVM